MGANCTLCQKNLNLNEYRHKDFYNYKKIKELESKSENLIIKSKNQSLGQDKIQREKSNKLNFMTHNKLKSKSQFQNARSAIESSNNIIKSQKQILNNKAKNAWQKKEHSNLELSANKNTTDALEENKNNELSNIEKAFKTKSLKIKRTRSQSRKPQQYFVPEKYEQEKKMSEVEERNNQEEIEQYTVIM